MTMTCTLFHLLIISSPSCYYYYCCCYYNYYYARPAYSAGVSPGQARFSKKPVFLKAIM